MRLIDADALYDCVEARYRLSSGEEHKTERVLLDAICDSPTIDAIPVEWLENRLNALFFEAMGAGGLYGDRIGDLAKSINEVMKLWQKEQEER